MAAKKTGLSSVLIDRISIKSSAAVITISFFILIETLAIKAFMLKHAGSYSSFVDVFRISGKEIIFVLIISFILIFLSSLTLRISYRWYSGFYALVAFIYSLSLIAQAVLFTTTGFGLNREYLQNYLKNPGEVNRMILSQLKLPYLIALLFLLVLFIWFSRLPDLKWLESLWLKLREKATFSFKKGVLVLIILFIIFLEAAALLPPLESVHPAIKQVPFFEMIESFIPEEPETVATAVEILPEERLGGPIILEPDKSFNQLNVVLIIFESLSWKYCDIYKPGLGATPFLAELGNKNLVVEKLYTVDPHTTKALITIIGGIYPYPEPEVLEARPGILPEKSLPHLLKRAGYRTAFFQTANNYEERPTVVSNLGYDLFRGLYHLPQEGFAYVNYFGKEEMMMLKPSLEWVDEDKKQPFFLTYMTLGTHHEYGFPPDFPAKDFGVKNDNLNRYLNAVRYTDYFIKRVFEEFEKRGLLKKTIFIIVGDHGEAFGEHGLSGHNYSLWEEGLRVPGIICAPALFTKPGEIRGFRSLLDIVPTVCDLIGLKIVEGEFVGKSLLTLPDDNREFFYTGWSESRVVAFRKGKDKYIFAQWDSFPEVYDNGIDSGDNNNVFKPKTEMVSEAEQYEARLKRWTNVLIAQYREWEKEAEEKFRSTKPEDFVNRISASFDGLFNAYGSGFFPEKTEPGRTVWVRVGLKCERKIKRPLRITVILKHEQNNLTYTQTLRPRFSLEELEAGNFATAESIMAIPGDWPVGKVRVYLGVLDERRGVYLKPEGDGFEQGESGLIHIGNITLFSADD